MYLNIKRVRSQGFMSFNNCEYSLDSLGMTHIVGINKFESKAESNGSGKSAIVEMILWGLTGNTSRGSKSVANYKLGIGVYVEIEFSVDDVDYIILRSKSHQDYGTKLQIMKNGEDISGSTVTKSNKILAEELRGEIDYELLTSVMILSQGLPNRLSTLSPSSRKSRLEDLSNLSEFIDKAVDKCKDSIKSIGDEISSNNSQIVSLESTNNKLNDVIRKNDIEIAKIDNYSDKVLSEEEISTIKDELSNIDNEILAIRSKEDSIKSTRGEYSTLENSINNEISVLNAFVRANNKRISELTNPNLNKCPTCGQDLPNTIDRSHIELEVSKLESSNMESNNNLSNYTSQIDILKSKIDSLDISMTSIRSQVDELNKKRYSLDTKLRDNEYASNSKANLVNSNKELLDTVECNKLEVARIEEIVSKLEDERSIAEYFKYRLSRDIRTHILSNVIRFLNSKCKEYSPYLFEDQGLVHLDEDSLDIYLDDREFRDLSGGEGRRVDIILQLAQRDLCRYESGISSNILVLDEVLDNLDGLGIESVIELLNYKSPDVNSMLIISHKKDIEIPYDTQIVVEKGPNEISYLK